MTEAMTQRDEVADLGTAVWEWRARQQPSMGDDIPRLPRPAGWLPDFSADAVARARRTRDELAARWRSIDVGDRDVAVQVDHRLIGSVLSRVTWELDVLQSWRRDPVFHVHQALGPYFDLLLPLPPFSDERAASIVTAIGNVPAAVDTALAVLDQPAGPLTAAAIELLDGIGGPGQRIGGGARPTRSRRPTGDRSLAPSTRRSPPSTAIAPTWPTSMDSATWSVSAPTPSRGSCATWR